MERDLLFPSKVQVKVDVPDIKVSGGITHDVNVCFNIPLTLWIIVGFLIGWLFGSLLRGKS
jgi:hypothetical protein